MRDIKQIALEVAKELLDEPLNIGQAEHYTDFATRFLAAIEPAPQQRDELLAALEKALAALETCTPTDYSTGHVIHASFDDAACAWAEETARAAIAKVKP